MRSTQWFTNARTAIRQEYLLSIFVVFLTFDGLYLLSDFYFPLSRVRIILLLGMLLIISINLFKIIQKGKVHRFLFSYMSVLIFLIFYGFYISFFMGGYFYFLKEPKLIVFIIVSVIFSYVLIGAFFNISHMNYWSAPFGLSLYFLASLLFFAITGAMEFSPFPLFTFESINGQGRHYSQSLTLLLGAASIHFYLKACNAPGLSALSWLAISVLFLLLTSSGGARGEFIATVLVLVLAELRNPSFIRVGVGLAVLILGGLYVAQQGYLQDIVVINRLMYLLESGTLGARDQLLLESFILLTDQPACIVLGCGYNYFQAYFDYDFGLHPHNIFIETIITFGMVVGLPIVLMALRGAWVVYISSNQRHFLFYFLFLLLLVGLKGGTLPDMVSMPVLLFFAFAPSLRNLSHR